MFVLTAKAKLTVLVSIENVSLRINYPRGPHDHENNVTYEHTNSTTTTASVLSNLHVFFKFVDNIALIAN